MAVPFGSQPRLPLCKGELEFTLRGKVDKYTVKICLLQKGILAVPETEVERIKGINHSNLEKIGHAPHYVEIGSLLEQISTKHCRFIAN